jgi:hypothetical protein
MIEKQTELGQTLFQINTSTLRALAEHQGQNIRNYVELNQEYGSKLSTISSVTDFLALQREYNASIWNGFKTSVGTQAGTVKNAVEETGAAFRVAFSQVEEAKPAKAKSTAKKKAKA